MNYYTSTIPVTLAEKLKEKGMPMILWQNENNTDYIEVLETRQEIFDESQTYEIGVRFQLPSYAEVLDWLMSEKGIEVEVYLSMTRQNAGRVVEKIYAWVIHSKHEYNGEEDSMTWHEAANAAIEKALILI